MSSATIAHKQNNKHRLQLFTLLLGLCSAATFGKSNNEWLFTSLSQEERTQVKTLIATHQSDIAVLPLDEYEAPQQALYLGSWLATQGFDALGQKVLNDALKYSSTYSRNDLGTLYQLLASTAETNNTAQAQHWYKKALALGNLTACVNFGVFYENSKAYQDAAKVYRQCTLPIEQVEITDQETVALAYLNLGTLHYNGRLSGDTNQERNVGAKLWQTAYALNPFDTQVHFNLAVYHSHITQDAKQARYHYSVCAWHFRECATALAHPRFVSLSGERQHLADLLKAKGVSRAFMLEARAQHWLPEPAYLSAEMPYGTLNIITSADENTAGIEVVFSSNHAQQAIASLNRLVFVDMFGQANALTYHWINALKPEQISHLGQTLRLTNESNQWRYQILFKDSSDDKSR